MAWTVYTLLVKWLKCEMHTISYVQEIKKILANFKRYFHNLRIKLYYFWPWYSHSYIFILCTIEKQSIGLCKQTVCITINFSFRPFTIIFCKKNFLLVNLTTHNNPHNQFVSTIRKIHHGNSLHGRNEWWGCSSIYNSSILVLNFCNYFYFSSKARMLFKKYLGF